MKILIAILLLLGMSTRVSTLRGGTGLDGVQPGSADGILQSIENANVTHAGEDLLVTRKDARTPVEMVIYPLPRAGGPVRREPVVGSSYKRNGRRRSMRIGRYGFCRSMRRQRIIHGISSCMAAI